jgi:hypothetical protein
MRAIAPKSAVGPVVFIFKNNGVPQDSVEDFKTLYNRFDHLVRADFTEKIASSGSDDDVIRQCNQTHHIEVLNRMWQYMKNKARSDREKNLSKWEFYWEKYEE